MSEAPKTASILAYIEDDADDDIEYLAKVFKTNADAIRRRINDRQEVRLKSNIPVATAIAIAKKLDEAGIFFQIAYGTAKPLAPHYRPIEEYYQRRVVITDEPPDIPESIDPAITENADLPEDDYTGDPKIDKLREKNYANVVRNENVSRRGVRSLVVTVVVAASLFFFGYQLSLHDGAAGEFGNGLAWTAFLGGPIYCFYLLLTSASTKLCSRCYSGDIENTASNVYRTETLDEQKYVSDYHKGPHLKWVTVTYTYFHHYYECGECGHTWYEEEKERSRPSGIP